MLRRLREFEPDRLLQAVLRHVPIGITIAEAPDVMILKVSDFGVELLQRPRDLLENIPVERHIDAFKVFRQTGDVASAEELPLTRAVKKGEVVRDEEWLVVAEDGRQIPILCNAGPIIDEEGNILGGIIAWADLTKQKALEVKLSRAIEEKEALFKELAHRSTNNLQVVSSLIEIHRKRSNITVDKFAEDLNRRIRNFSEIQHLLYSDEAHNSVPLWTIIQKICSAYETEARRIVIKSVPDQLIDREQAQPLGMIVNEVVCNCAEHAFDADQNGTIEVIASAVDGQLQVHIADDGRGFEETEESASLGLRLVRIFAAQLGGSSSYARRAGGGTVFSLRFPLPSIGGHEQEIAVGE